MKTPGAFSPQDRVAETLTSRTRMRRNATPDDIAHAAVYLASPAASWVTGILHRVDGEAVDEFRPMGPDL
jgi:NAD(P)-dependent dehydrogenase (short-subunit alcohol dehydrogenase family)